MFTVRATGLVKTFGTVTAVNDLSFEARAGEFLTLLGPSGCGKTTTLRLVAGLERPDRGEILVGDRPISSAASGLFVPPERRGMGMVFQSYAIWPHMTVFENVAFPLQEPCAPRRDPRASDGDARQWAGRSSRRPAPMLGRPAVRIALARARVEPGCCSTSRLEPRTRLREEMRFELREIQAKLRITSIFVTHDQAEAMTLDHIVIMNAGASSRKAPRGRLPAAADAIRDGLWAAPTVCRRVSQG
jgi:iron(III) transport system ATP-binding protein